MGNTSLVVQLVRPHAVAQRYYLLVVILLVDIRAIPTETAWDVGCKASALIERYTQENGVSSKLWVICPGNIYHADLMISQRHFYWESSRCGTVSRGG